MTKKEVEECPKVYLFLIEKIREKNNNNNKIKRKVFCSEIGIIYHLTGNKRKILLEELEKNNLIRQIGRDYIEIIL